MVATATNREHKVRQVELLISGLLRVGVLVSLVLVVIGSVLTFWHNPSYLTDASETDKLTSVAATFPHTLADVLSGIAHMNGAALVMLGLLLLIATPVMRVAVSIVGFAYQGDRTYVIITSVVLALLLLSFALGRASG